MPRYPKAQPQIEPLLLNVYEAASLLGIGKSTLWQLIRDGEIPTAKIGSRTLVHRQVVERFAARAFGDGSWAISRQDDPPATATNAKGSITRIEMPFGKAGPPTPRNRGRKRRE